MKGYGHLRRIQDTDIQKHLKVTLYVCFLYCYKISELRAESCNIDRVQKKKFVSHFNDTRNAKKEAIKAVKKQPLYWITRSIAQEHWNISYLKP
jgi:hypothetical protein